MMYKQQSTGGGGGGAEGATGTYGATGEASQETEDGKKKDGDDVIDAEFTEK